MVIKKIMKLKLFIKNGQLMESIVYSNIQQNKIPQILNGT